MQYHALPGPHHAATMPGIDSTSGLACSDRGTEAAGCCLSLCLPPCSPSMPGFTMLAAQRPLAPSMWHSLPFRLASCGGDRNIFQWDVSTGKIIRKFRGHDGDVNAVSAQVQAGLQPAGLRGDAVQKPSRGQRSLQGYQSDQACRQPCLAASLCDAQYVSLSVLAQNWLGSWPA